MTRTIENGRNFPQVVKDVALSTSPFCMRCKQEKPTQVDHIRPLHWGGKSVWQNAGAICGRCHFLKTRSERDVNDTSEQDAHVARWLKVHFDAKGMRRTITENMVQRNKETAKRVHKAKMNARLHKRDGRRHAAHAEHVRAAQARREGKKRA